MHSPVRHRYASARMTVATTDAPNLPLVIGLPMLCMLVAAIIVAAVYVAMGRVGWR